MTRDVIVVPPELTLPEAWFIMQRQRIRHLPVVRAGELLGIVSDRDVLLRAGQDGAGEVHVANVLVAEAMTPRPTTAEETTSVSELVRVMTERKIDAIPIMRGTRLRGLVTSTDLLLLLLEREEAQPDPRRLPFEFRIIEGGLASA